MTVAELIVHYREHELDRKAFASQENHGVLTKLYIEPRWGGHQLSSVRTIDVESGLDGLDPRPGIEDQNKEHVFCSLFPRHP